MTVPPEAELGAYLVELEYLPILGRGNQVWLGKWLDVDPQYFLKLHPLHTLAALQMVLRCPYSKSLEAAAGPGRDEIPSPAWITLNSARVSLYEDTPKGVPSLQAVQEALVSAALESRSKAMVLPASMLSARHWTIL